MWTMKNKQNWQGLPREDNRVYLGGMPAALGLVCACIFYPLLLLILLFPEGCKAGLH